MQDGLDPIRRKEPSKSSQRRGRPSLLLVKWNYNNFVVGVGGGSHDLGLEMWARFQQLEGGKWVPGVGKVMSCVRVRGMA